MKNINNTVTKLGYIFLVLDLLSSLLLILNMTLIQNAVVQYIGLVGMGLSVGFVMFLMITCVCYFVSGFKNMINHGWFK